MPTIILCYPSPVINSAQLPIGLYKIAAYCSRMFDVCIVDGRLENAAVAINTVIERNDVIYLGLSVMTGKQILSAITLSKLFHSKVPIVWGGFHPTILPEQTLENKFVDYVIVGEGELQAYNLAVFLIKNRGKRPQYTGYNATPLNFKHFDKFCEQGALPYKDIDFPKEYLVSRDGMNRVLNLETSRGCFYSCKFCHNSMYPSHYKFCSAEDIISSIQYLKKKYSIDGIIFQEDNFFANIERINLIYECLVKESVLWKANVRISSVLNKKHSNLIVEAGDAGCKMLQLGVESGSDHILKLINKKISVADILHANKKLAKLKIPVRYNFIIGFPNETKEQIITTLNMSKRLQDDNPYMVAPFINIYTPYPGTKLYNDALSAGFIAPTSLYEWGDLHWNSPSKTMHKDLYDFLLEYSQKALTKTSYSKFLTGENNEKY